jgi:SpoVK/Ycf46/Vps4 family AAA+-type ATPase
MPDVQGSVVLSQRRLEVDELIDFPGSLASQILEEIEKFWGLGERFHQYGFLHRRGYLLHGKQGSGKSSLIHLIISRAVQKDCVAFFCEEPYLLAEGVQQFRSVEPKRPILCVFEDIDTFIRYSGDGQLLQWLDGNRQVDKVVNIATTNFPEQLDRRIAARPRRFDRVVEIESPDAQLRDAYFQRKVPDLSVEERDQWVAASEGLTFAALAELIISVRCLENDLDQSAALLRELDRHAPSSDDYDDLEQRNRTPEEHNATHATFTDCIPF